MVINVTNPCPSTHHRVHQCRSCLRQAAVSTRSTFREEVSQVTNRKLKVVLGRTSVRSKHYVILCSKIMDTLLLDILHNFNPRRSAAAANACAGVQLD